MKTHIKFISILLMSLSLYAIDDLQTREQVLSSQLNDTKKQMQRDKEKLDKLSKQHRLIKTRIKLEDLKKSNPDILHIYNYIEYKDSKSNNLLCYLRRSGYQNVNLSFDNIDKIVDNNDLKIIRKSIDEANSFIKNTVENTCEPNVKNKYDYIIYAKSSKDRILKENPLMGNKAPSVNFGINSKGAKYLRIPRGTFIKLLNVVKIKNIKWVEIQVTFNKTTKSGWIEVSKIRKVCKF